MMNDEDKSRSRPDRHHAHGHAHVDGHGHSGHSFDHASSFLLSEERRKWQDPSKIIGASGIAEGWNVIDVGSGPCFFAAEIASRVGKGGKVYALDSSSVLLSKCVEIISGKGIANVFPLLADADSGFPIVDGKLDAVFMANVLHDFAKPDEVVREAGRVLRSGGLMINLDWKKMRTEFGPPEEMRLSEEESRKIIRSGPFDQFGNIDAGPFHYCLTFRKF